MTDTQADINGIVGLAVILFCFYLCLIF